MNKYHLLALMAVVTVGILSTIPLSESTLQDLIIYSSIKNSTISQGQFPIIGGIVEDHAGKPVTDTSVEIRVSTQTVVLTTNQSGTFEYEFKELELIPGRYIVNIKAISSDGRMGLSTVNFQVTGETSLFAQTEKLLETTEARKYLNSNIEDYKNNPIGISLYNYYQSLQKKFLEQKMIQEEIERNNHITENERLVATNITNRIIQEQNPGAGVYSGFKRDVFVDNLDLDVKGIIQDQLDYTLIIFKEAQDAMNQVLANGGTVEEARQAYLEKASISQEMMYSLNMNDNGTIPVGNSTNVIMNGNAVLTSIPQSNITNSTIFNNNGTIQVGNSTIIINNNNTSIPQSNIINSNNNGTITTSIPPSANHSTNIIFGDQSLQSNNSQIMSEKEDGYTLFNFNGTDIKVGPSTTVIYININGTMHQYFINGTKVDLP